MIELTINHDGVNWVARNDVLSAEAASLKELDNDLKELLKERGDLKKGEKLDMFMAFDNTTLPVWMRQYAQHYFNRMVRVENEPVNVGLDAKAP